MLLNEFIYFDKDHGDPVENDRYDITKDQNVLKVNDLRKTERLTLKVLRDLRKAGEAREKEQREDLALVRTMYATPDPEEAAAPV
jgi:hypothetical protein